MSAANYPATMSAVRQRNWRKLRSFAFVFPAATAFILVLQWTGWRPVSDPVTALVILAALVIVPRVARIRRSQGVVANEAER